MELDARDEHRKLNSVSRRAVNDVHPIQWSDNRIMFMIRQSHSLRPSSHVHQRVRGQVSTKHPVNHEVFMSPNHKNFDSSYVFKSFIASRTLSSSLSTNLNESAEFPKFFDILSEDEIEALEAWTKPRFHNRNLLDLNFASSPTLRSDGTQGANHRGVQLSAISKMIKLVRSRTFLLPSFLSGVSGADKLRQIYKNPKVQQTHSIFQTWEKLKTPGDKTRLLGHLTCSLPKLQISGLYKSLTATSSLKMKTHDSTQWRVNITQPSHEHT